MSLWQDLRFGARLLVKGRWFTLAAIVALALGIGANVTVFTIVNAVLLRDLPFEDPDQIVMFGMQNEQGLPSGISFPNFQDWRTETRSFSNMVFVVTFPCNVSDDDNAPEQYTGTYASVDLFRMLNERPIVGRDFTDDDGRPGAPPVTILGHGIWSRRYGSDPQIVGKVVRLQGIAATVIGVAPEGMRFPFNTDLWIPEVQWLPGAPERDRAVHRWTVIGRMSDGISLEQARAEMATVGAQLRTAYPKENQGMSPLVDLFSQRMLGPQIRIIFWSLMGAVVFVLLIACANVANLLLARAADRSTEIGVRISLGATRWQIVRQLLVESVLLACIAGILGFGLSIFGIRAFDAVTQNVGVPYWMTFTLEPRVFAFFAVVCLATGVMFGLAPALHISRTNLNDVLKEGGGRSGSAGSSARRWTGVLIVGELALTLILLAGAGFMVRSFLVLYNTEVGVDTSSVLTARMQLPGRKYPSVDDRTQFVQRVDERLAAMGEIVGGTTTTALPLGPVPSRQLTLDGQVQAGTQLPTVGMISVGPHYFDTIGVPLVRGRMLDVSDGQPGRENVLINQRLASMFFPGEDPIGRRLKLDTPGNDSLDDLSALWLTVVGIAPSIRQVTFGPSGISNSVEPEPMVYVPYRMNPIRRSSPWCVPGPIRRARHHSSGNSCSSSIPTWRSSPSTRWTKCLRRTAGRSAPSAACTRSSRSSHSSCPRWGSMRSRRTR